MQIKSMSDKDFCSILPNQFGLPTRSNQETTLVKSLKNMIAVLLRSKSGTIYQAQKFMLDRNSRSKINNESCLHENIAQPNNVPIIFHTYKGSEVKMIAFEEAQKRLLEIPHKSKTTEIDIHKCIGKISSRDHSCILPLPHWDNSAMDGFALRSQDLLQERSIVEEIPAGTWPTKEVKEESMLSNIYRCTTSNGF